MNRYDPNHNTLTTNTGKPFFGTTYYPNIVSDPSDILYISQETDYLDELAYRFYKDTTLWWIIAQTNQLGSGRLSVPAGLQLRIPTRIDVILTEFNKINS